MCSFLFTSVQSALFFAGETNISVFLYFCIYFFIYYKPEVHVPQSRGHSWYNGTCTSGSRTIAVQWNMYIRESYNCSTMEHVHQGVVQLQYNGTCTSGSRTIAVQWNMYIRESYNCGTMEHVHQGVIQLQYNGTCTSGSRNAD